MYQRVGRVQGQAKGSELHANELRKLRAWMNDRRAMHTGKTAEVIAADTERDRYLTAEEALEYGVVDEVVAPRKAHAFPSK